MGSKKQRRQMPEPVLLPSMAVAMEWDWKRDEEAPMDNSEVWLSQMEVEALFGIGRTKWFAMRRHDRRFFRGQKTTATLIAGFQATHPNFTVREEYP